MRTIFNRRLCLAIALLGTSLLSSNVLAQDDLKGEIQKLGQPYIDSKTVVGMSIGVIKDGKMTTVNLGSTGKDGSSPNDNTVYEIGSVSKVFTGVLLADAVVTKAVKLDQTAQSLLPDDVTMPKWKNREITLLDLATHRSGLPRLSDNMPRANPDDPYADYPSKLAYEFLNKHKLKSEPGRKSEYSNFGMSLLGHLISSQSGKSYDELLQERISKPLGMTDTRVKLTDSMRKRLALPHTAAGGAESQLGFCRHAWSWRNSQYPP